MSMSMIETLTRRAALLRQDILEMAHVSNGPAHPGPSLSCADLFAVLYFHAMRLDANKPYDPERDRLVLSKGHAAPVLYAALCQKGFFPKEWYAGLRGLHGALQGHPAYGKTPGVDMTSGSLGNGLSVAAGMALSLRQSKSGATVYAVMGDGELQEGLIWEACQYAGGRELDNLVAIVDNNGFQSCGRTDDILPRGHLDERFRAFGWNAIVIDGHDIAQIVEALHAAKRRNGSPTVIIANTVKGKGVSFMENNNSWHQRALTDDEFDLALSELKRAIA